VHIFVALGDVVVQQLDAVYAHEAEEGVLALLKVGGQLAAAFFGSTMRATG
jgi:hypothetical protein